MSVKVTLSLFVVVLALVNSASILDYLDWEDGKKLIEVPEVRSDQTKKNCLCKGPACVCCVDFNITFVDLGGPGCVHMKYLSQEEGFSVNVSYGKSILHNTTVKAPNPEPKCVEIFGQLAHVCAVFTDFGPTDDGLKGCLELEPNLLREVRLNFPIGCFKASAGKMEVEDPPVKPEQAEEGEEETGEEDNAEFDAVSFLLDTYKTAQKGVEYVLGSILDIPFQINKTTTAKPPTSTTVQASTDSQRRAPKNFKHPNQL